MVTPVWSAPDLTSLKLPPGFKATVYADLDKSDAGADARIMVFDTDGSLYVSMPRSNKIVRVTDENRDGTADKVETVIKGLNAPHGMVLQQDKLYVANEDGMVVFTRSQGQWSKKGQVLISGLATGGHTLKSLKLSPDGYLFINVGSSCNVCNESDPSRATLLRYTLDGKPAGALTTVGRHAQSAIWARGLRNTQGYTWHPVTGAMYATNNGSDNRAATKGGPVDDELPPEHLNKVEGGKHYGWPHCWGGMAGNAKSAAKPQFEDPKFPGEAGFCKTTQPPAITFTSHSTPIGITFLNKAAFPQEYQDDAIVALHGSWNRKQPSGYKLVRVKFKDNEPVEVSDFMTGWLQGDEAWGRPIDVAVGTDKSLYVSDDKTGIIYRVTYQTGHITP